MKSNFGLMDYELINNMFNIGDYVQSIAARSYLPRVDKIISRERMDSYQGEKLKMILNGWFMHHPENWPPSPDIEPLFISFHINRPYAERMLVPNSISYLKDCGKIGCRDYHTAEMLSDHGIDAYYSSCLTTTLKNPSEFKGNLKKNKIMLVDAFHAVPSLSSYIKLPARSFGSHIKSGNFIRSLIKKSHLNKLLDVISTHEECEVEIHENSINGANLSTSDRFKMAEQYLNSLSESKLVVTSRIHCALPCLALNIPVVFVKFGQQSKSNTYRFRGIIDHLNVLDLDGDIKRNNYDSVQVDFEDLSASNNLTNPSTHLVYADKLRLACEKFIQG